MLPQDDERILVDGLVEDDESIGRFVGMMEETSGMPLHDDNLMVAGVQKMRLSREREN